MGVPDFAVEFGFGDECGNGVDNDDVDGVGFDEHFGDLEPFFAVGGLADEQFVEVDTEPAGPLGVECMFGVDEGGDPAFFLSAGDGVQGERCFAAGFRAEKLKDAAARKTATAKGEVQRQGTGGNAGEATDVFGGVQFHDRTLAEHFFNLADCVFEQSLVFVLRFGRSFF